MGYRSQIQEKLNRFREQQDNGVSGAGRFVQPPVGVQIGSGPFVQPQQDVLPTMGNLVPPKNAYSVSSGFESSNHGYGFDSSKYGFGFDSSKYASDQNYDPIHR